MRVLFVSFLCVLVALSYWSCSNRQVQMSTEAQNSSAFASKTICSQEETCETDCKEIFEKHADLIPKCKKQTTEDVKILKKTLRAMKTGAWSSIKPENMKILTEFSSSLWTQYADVNQEQTKNMLIWITEQPAVAELLDSKNAILQKAFLQLALSGKETEDQVLSGMRSIIDSEDHTFLENSVLEENEPAFKAGHDLLAEACETKSANENDDDNEEEAKAECLKDFYCDLDKGAIFAYLNRLDLNEDIKDSGSFTSYNCPS